MHLVYVSLVSKKQISISDMNKPKDKKLVVKADDFESIGKWLVKNPGWEFMCSSSVNHPKEYGFKDGFDVGDVMGKAVEYACRKLAVPVEPGEVAKAPAVIEAAIKQYKYPGRVPLLLLRSGKNKKDVLIQFEREELETFVSGIKYAANLLDLQAES